MWDCVWFFYPNRSTWCWQICIGRLDRRDQQSRATRKSWDSVLLHWMLLLVCNYKTLYIHSRWYWQEQGACSSYLRWALSSELNWDVCLQGCCLCLWRELRWPPWPWMWFRASPIWIGFLFGSKPMPSSMEEIITEQSILSGEESTSFRLHIHLLKERLKGKNLFLYLPSKISVTRMLYLAFYNICTYLQSNMCSILVNLMSPAQNKRSTLWMRMYSFIMANLWSLDGNKVELLIPFFNGLMVLNKQNSCVSFYSLWCWWLMVYLPFHLVCFLKCYCKLFIWLCSLSYYVYFLQLPGEKVSPEG